MAITSEYTAGSAIKITKLNKWFGDFHVLKDIDLSIDNGERVVICGPSGSGKSTLIRCVNALESHNSGDIELFGVSIQDYQTNNNNCLKLGWFSNNSIFFLI